MSDGPFYSAEHNPNEVQWRPVKRRKAVDTGKGSVIVKPGEDVELIDLEDGTNWGMGADDFYRRYGKSLKGKALEAFKEHYPGIAE
jgi:hypothetical protein